MKKIKLNRETVRQLDDHNLSQVQGGAKPVTQGNVCTRDCQTPPISAVDCESVFWCLSVDVC